MRYLCALILSLWFSTAALGDGQPLWQQRTGGGGNQQLSGVRATSISVTPSELWVDVIHGTTYVGYPTPLPTATPITMPTPQPTPTPVDLTPYTQRAVNEPISGVWAFNGDSGSPYNYSMVFGYTGGTDGPIAAINNSGVFAWGEGGDADVPDTFLQRSAANTLQVLKHFKIGADSASTAVSENDYLYIGGTSVRWDEFSDNAFVSLPTSGTTWKFAKPTASPDPYQYVLVAGPTEDIRRAEWGVQWNGKMGWGAVDVGTSPDLFDTHLWRREAGVLQTEGLYVNGTITAGSYANYPTPLPTATPQPTPTPIPLPLSATNGGTGQNSSGWTGFPKVVSGTWSAQSPGSGNQILGMNNWATDAEWKTINGTANRLTATHSEGAITLDLANNPVLVKSVADIAAPSAAELGNGTTQGDLIIAYQAAASASNNATLYMWDTSSAAESKPDIVAGTGGSWIAIGGRYCALSFQAATLRTVRGNYGGTFYPATIAADMILRLRDDSYDFSFVNTAGAEVARVTSAGVHNFKGGHTDVVHYQDVLAAANDAILTSANFGNGTLSAVGQPDVPRAIRLYVSVTGGSGQTATVTINGTDADGATISQVWTGIDLGSAWTVTTNHAYALVTNVVGSANTGGPYTATVEVGTTTKLGLPNYPFNATGDVFKQKRNNANESVGSVSATYGTVDVTSVTGGDDFTWWVRPYK